MSEGIPGTGPYMLEAPVTDERLALVRNPHFQVWSPAQPDGYVERIEWTFGVEPQDQVEAVAAGEADLALEAAGSGRLEELLARFPAQVHTSPLASTYFITLNTGSPPFDHVGVRRAINLALDRDRVVQILGGEGAAIPTCQQLPPNFPGYEPYCPYTIDPAPGGSGPWAGPDLERAKRIISRSGTAGMRVVFDWPPAFWPAPLADYMVELLGELGYRGSVRSFSNEAFYTNREFQMALNAFAADYPAASYFFFSDTCHASLAPVSAFCDPRIDSMVDRAIDMPAEDPAAGALWAEIDHAMVDQAPYLWLVNPIAVDFVSERVGNYQFSLSWTVLLNQLWVR